ncbi:potassium-transporting ATPase subunit KdpA, partial [Roseiarcus sp.]|uniref:potassium-transporting ATPase subunit KdpA n=1 Tax=Roseiarcus sp. TaxID=1969460 RepID=UPI003F950714
KQAIAIGPVASQEAIKLIGDNGGGFFNANSAHPFENPSVWSNVLQNWSQLVLPVALVFAFGRMARDVRQGHALLIMMAVIFVIALAVVWKVEAAGNPALAALGVDSSLGNLEGKDLRFGHAGAALFVDATTGTGTGASNAVLESAMPLSGLVAMFNLLLGCISPGGVGTGLYSLILLVLITAFIGALMIGRTPEYLGKEINSRDMQFATFALLLSPALVLVFAGAASVIKIALDSLGVGGPHGLSEIVYAYASSAADNGSAFAGLNANTPWWNVTTGIAMFLGRFAHAIPILAIAGSLAAKKKAKPSAGTMPTDGALFIGFLLAVILVVTLLQYLPALALGPVAEHVLAARGATF